ncbi:MAG: DNA-binding protein [Pseudomonadota bacterium]
MKTVTLELQSPEEAMGNFVQTWRANTPDESAHIAFSSPELLWEVLTPNRWELLKALCGAGPISIYDAARRVDRDVKEVDADICALLNVGVLDPSEGDAIIFPYDAVKVEFMLRAA